jgi:hypothetical protein
MTRSSETGPEQGPAKAVPKSLDLYAHVSSCEWCAQWQNPRRSPLFRLFRLPAKQWLRRLILHPSLYTESNLIFCPHCGIKKHVDNPVYQRVCLDCSAYALPLNAAFWECVSARLKRAKDQDQTLIVRIRREFPGLTVPLFEGPLAWITEQLQQAPNPRGRPKSNARWVVIGLFKDFLTKPCVRGGKNPKDPQGQYLFEKVPSLTRPAEASRILQGSQTLRAWSTGTLSVDEAFALNKDFQTALKRKKLRTVIEEVSAEEIREVREEEIRRASQWFKQAQNIAEVIRHGPPPKHTGGRKNPPGHAQRVKLKK